MFGEGWTGLLLVASAVFGVICLIVFEGVRTRLRSIPEQAHLLNQQIAAIHMENQTADLVKAKAEQVLEEITGELEAAGAQGANHVAVGIQRADCWHGLIG